MIRIKKKLQWPFKFSTIFCYRLLGLHKGKWTKLSFHMTRTLHLFRGNEVMMIVHVSRLESFIVIRICIPRQICRYFLTKSPSLSFHLSSLNFVAIHNVKNLKISWSNYCPHLLIVLDRFIVISACCLVAPATSTWWLYETWPLVQISSDLSDRMHACSKSIKGIRAWLSSPSLLLFLWVMTCMRATCTQKKKKKKQYL